MTNKANKFFHLMPDAKIRSFYFKENIQDQILFYPWGCPGEAYKVTQEQQSKLLQFVYSMFFLLILPTAGTFFYFSNVSQGLFDANWVIVPSITCYLIIHFIGNWIFAKRLEPHETTTINNPRKRPVKLIKILLALGIVQFLYGLLGLYFNPESSLMLSTTIFVVILYCLLMTIAFLSRGFIFQK